VDIVFNWFARNRLIPLFLSIRNSSELWRPNNSAVIAGEFIYFWIAVCTIPVDESIMMMASFALKKIEENFSTLNSSLWIRFCSLCNILKSNLLNEFCRFEFDLQTHSTYLGLFLAVVLGIFRQMKALSTAFFIFFSNRVLTSPLRNWLYPLIILEIWENLKNFCDSVPTNGIGFDVYFPYTDFSRRSALT
jgi:hypothetical protein